MKTLLSFLGGASLVFVFGTLGLSQTAPSSTAIISFSWFAGIVVGCWGMGMFMFLFAQAIVNFSVPRFQLPPPIPERFSPQEIPTAEIVDEPANGVDIYEDPDWWKDEKKRQQHRRNNG